ncbi:MAG: hypothetical protein ABR607_00090 [Pyrinomonadaceae bacterium]
MKFKSLIFVMLALAATTARSQEPWPQERSNQREEAVINEDGGRSYLVLPAAAPLARVAKPGAGFGDLQQHSIFLGSGWADPALRAREVRLGKLLATIHDHAQMDEIAQAGFTNRFGPTFTIEKLDVTDNRKISDLEIQHILAGLFANGPLTEPQADSVYIVFLDPGLQSTLRSLTAGKHYLAYHSFFNASGSRVHYAVVPYQADPVAAYQVALRTLVVAALHTEDPQ